MELGIQMPALDRDKLVKMLGMLGSRHDGEVAAAGRSAHTLLRDARTTWTEVLTPPDEAEACDRYKLAEAEAENRRLVVELAQRQLEIDNLIAKHQQEIRELHGANHREKTSGFASIKTLIGWAAMGVAAKTVIGWAATGLAVWSIGAMIWGAPRTQEIQVLRGGSLAAPAGIEALQLHSPSPQIDSFGLFHWINDRVQGWSRVLGSPAQHSPMLKTPTKTQ
jgi:hypothetical protein